MNKNLQPIVVIVSGGKGSRLALGDLPKPMVDIDGVPLLERTVTNLAGQGIRHFIFLTGHGASVIAGHFGNGSKFGVTIEYFEEQTPLGTAGGFDRLREKLTTPFLVCYGDLLFDIDIKRFMSWATRRGGLGSLYVHPNDHPFDSDLIDADEDGQIIRFVSKPHDGENCGNLVNAAFYWLTPEALDFIPRGADTVLDWGHDVFPAIVSSGKMLFAYRGSEYLRDIGTPGRLAVARSDFVSGVVAKRCYRNKQRAIFLDRDGVLNREIGGVFRPEFFELMPDVPESVRRINQSDFLAICVTNQSAIAKGFMTFDDLKQVHWRLDAELARSGAFLDDLFFCPHHPERGFPDEVAELKIDCMCRKPKPGMLLAAAERHNLDLRRCYLIGDAVRDIDAAAAVGATGLLIQTGESMDDLMADEGACRARVYGSFGQALDMIFSNERGEG